MNIKNDIALLLLSMSLAWGIPCTVQAAGNARGMKIEIIAPQWAGKTLKLVSYYDGERYAQDTVRLSSKGIGVFHSGLKYPEGLYMIHLDSLRFFDILLADDQEFRIMVDSVDFVRNSRIEGSRQSEAFLEYPRFISARQRDRAALMSEFNTLKAEKKETEEVTTRLELLNKEVAEFQDAFFKKYEGLWVARFFKGLVPVETGPYPIARTLEQRYHERQYQKAHFFDNIDLQDSRFWYTNYLPAKIEQYITSIVEQEPDTIARAASWLVAQTLGDSVCARMMLGRLMNYALKSDLMGMENVWACLAEDYYFTGRVYMPDSVFMARLRSEYRNIHYNRIGMQAQNLTLQDSTGMNVDLYDLPGKLKLFYFFEPDCGFCKKTTPRIYREIYKKYKDKGLSVACICIINDRNEWLNYIRENNLMDWYNLWDPNRTSYFWQYYDTSITPGIYVVDENHRIIAKKLDVESLNRLFSMVLK